MYATLHRILLVGILVLLASIPGFSLSAQTADAHIAPLLGVNSSTAIEDHYIVVLKDKVSKQALPDLERTVRGKGGSVRFRYETALKGFAAHLPAPAVEHLRKDARIAYIEADQEVHLDAVSSWGLDRIDQRSLPLNQSYTPTSNGAGVHAYILDTGIRATHTDFGGRVSSQGFTAIDDGNGFNDCNGHGTHVAGTVGGTSYGVANEVTLHSVRVLRCDGGGWGSWAIAGVEWVTANKVLPAVANMSLGGSANTSLDTAIRNSIAAGVTYVVAAGNETSDACSRSPAREPEAITVGATDSQDVRASFSNYGTCMDLFAPGVYITSASHGSDTGLIGMSGTSMAAPHVAGVAALYLSASPGASPAEVAAAIITQSTPNVVGDSGPGSPNRLLYALLTPAPLPTSTPLPTAMPPTNTPLPTSTPVPPTNTPTAGPTSTPIPTAVLPTSVPPMPTATRIPTPTPTPEVPRLFLSPSTTTIGQGQTFQLDLTFDTAGKVADTVDGYMTFDPAVLEVVDAAGNPATSITPNAAVVGSVSYNRVDAATGKIDFSASQYDSPYLRGTATVATIRFRAKAPVESTSVQLIRNGLRQSDLFLGGTRLQAILGHATIRIVDGALICGRIAVEQRGPAGTARWITPLFRTEGSTTTGGVTLYQPGTSTEVGRFTATTDANGRFCVTATGVPAGTYDVQVKGANTLSNQRANVDLRTATEVSYGTLLVGDSTGDDGVTGADVSYMVPVFLTQVGDAGFRPYADTNRDDTITGADVSALIPNFLRGGPIAVTGAAKLEPQESRVQSGTPPQITLNPAKQQVQVGEIVPVAVQVELGATPADTVDLYVNLDPALLEIVDTAGQPVRSLNVNRSAFADVTYNRVDATTGQISFSASRLTAPAATGALTVATFYVRAKQRFTTTALTIASTGTRRADVFARGQSLQPVLTGSVLTMGDLYRIYIPHATQ